MVFEGKIDGMFCTCDIGFGKNEDSYWKAVKLQLEQKYPDIIAEEIVYFDDRLSLVEKAKEFGISAYLYQDNDTTKKLLV